MTHKFIPPTITILMLATSFANALTSVSINSNTGYDRKYQIIDPTNGSVKLIAASKDHLEFEIDGLKKHMTIKMDAPDHETFKVGDYKRVAEYPIDTKAAFQLKFDFESPRIGREFTVKEFALNSQGQLERIAINFVTEGMLYGAIRYQSTVADDVDDYEREYSPKTATITYTGPVKTYSKDSRRYTVNWALMTIA